ncbi:hypothetical protein HDU97_001612 [Phlyctochytrium planicorne]|nr:hypothetical protein HDU97_001612 [Phlyctochytrium planicorne]
MAQTIPQPYYKVASTDAEKEAAYTIRHRIFCLEQGYPHEAESDHLDSTSTHVLALIPPQPHLSHLPSLPPHSAIGTARVYLERREGQVVGRIQRVAVDKEARGMRIGGGLVKMAEEALKQLVKEAKASQEGVEVIAELHSQVSKRGFYEKLGYVRIGDEYIEDEAPHVTMIKTVEL